MLEKMGDFFNRRLSGYEEHQLNAIEGASEFYPFTARLLPMREGAKVLDLGCGTGLELDCYFALNPSAHVTGIDLAEDMLAVLKEKFGGKELDAVFGSYFDVPFERDYDCIVSVESLHQFTKEEKTPLYRKSHIALRGGGYFILTDYFAKDDEEEEFYRQEYNRLKAEQGIADGEFYHYDMPLTVDHEIAAFTEAGFSSVKILKHWGSTYTLKAEK